MPRAIAINYQQSTRLKAALATIYRTPARFDTVLGDVGRSYNGLEKGNLTYEENVASIVAIAAADGWLMELIARILAEVPDDELLAIQQELRPWAAVARIDPFQVCRLTGSNVMVDRTDLRGYLRAMANPYGKRLLVVKGPRRSGRTHTLQLLSYLEQEQGGFTLTSIDLESFARMAGVQVASASNETPIQIVTHRMHGFTSGNTVSVEGVGGNTGANGLWTITVTSPSQFLLNDSAGNGAYVSGGMAKLQTPIEAWHIAEKLVHLLLYNDLKLPDAPTEGSWSRWVLTFCDLFEGTARLLERQRLQQIPPRPPHQVWIVVDAFHAVPLALSSLDLIRELANRINLTLHHFRMVLLGFEDSLPAQVGNHLEEEAIRSIGLNEIVEFFGLAFSQMRIPMDQDKVVAIVQRVLEEVDPNDPDFVAKLGPVASRELAKLEGGHW
jgi:hypothetical protein